MGARLSSSHLMVYCKCDCAARYLQGWGCARGVRVRPRSSAPRPGRWPAAAQRACLAGRAVGPHRAAVGGRQQVVAQHVAGRAGGHHPARASRTMSSASAAARLRSCSTANTAVPAGPGGGGRPAPASDAPDRGWRSARRAGSSGSRPARHGGGCELAQGAGDVHALALAAGQVHVEAILQGRAVRRRRGRRAPPSLAWRGRRVEARHGDAEHRHLEHRERKGQHARLRHDGAPPRQLGRREGVEGAAVEQHAAAASA